MERYTDSDVGYCNEINERMLGRKEIKAKHVRTLHSRDFHFPAVLFVPIRRTPNIDGHRIGPQFVIGTRAVCKCGQ